MPLAMLPLLIITAVHADILRNPGFEEGLKDWQQASAEGVIYDASILKERHAGHILVPATATVSFPRLFQSFDVVPGDILCATAEAMGRGVRDGYGIYVVFEFFDSSGARITTADSSPAGPEGEWTPFVHRAIVPAGITHANFCLVFNGHGEAWFTNCSLTKMPSISPAPLQGLVTLTVTKEVVCESFHGFGAEDDGWFYNNENAAQGVNEEDVRIREERIRWMDPDWVRMFVWHKDWCPSWDGATFVFDSTNMRSHYRTLDLYQSLGATVNVTGVEWGIADPYKDVPRVAKAIGALLEHLIRTKGYTCVQEWTLTNEPNTWFLQRGYTFNDYVNLHRLVKAELIQRKLEVRIVGSDDVNDLAWITRCVKNPDYDNVIDLYASHRYLKFTDINLIPYFFTERQSLFAAQNMKKPFIVAEFGFQDSRSTALLNPLMETYDYALWAARFVIEGLNQGTAGFSIWCLHEVYYPGNNLMNYGLWDYKDNHWKPRPVYYAWANFSRLTEAGDKVFKCESSNPQLFSGAKVGDTIFWLNRSDSETEIRIEGFPARTARILTESTLSGDRECGKTITLRKGTFQAPARSFGYVQKRKV